MDQIDELLNRGVENILPDKSKLEKILRSGKKLNIYLGIDPTSTKIHLGHAVPLRKMQLFAELGHQVTFLIGDFTALIGDTSDKDGERPSLSYNEIKQNFETYKEQAEKFLNFNKIKVRFNSEWLNKLNFPEIVKLCQYFSAGDFFSRELIKKRLNEGKHVGLHELLYPVMQGYDSYFLDTDIQLGGTDQTFNMQAGRILQKSIRNKESFIISNGFLTGTDGRKMSKTWNNAVWIKDSPVEIFGKIMSLKDDLIQEYFTLATNIPLQEIEIVTERLKSGENPMVLKKELAKKIVEELYGVEKANYAVENFTSTVQNKEKPTEMPVYQLSNLISSNATVCEVVSSILNQSHSQAKKLTEQGGVELDDQKITNPNTILSTGILKLGKRKYVKLIK